MTTGDEVYELTFAAAGGARGLVRLAVRAGRASFRAELEGAGFGLVVVADDDLAPPRPGPVRTVRGDGLWAEVVCEAPGEHWSFALEAFGLRVDDPSETVGERLPVGYDLELEVGTGELTGEVVVARDRFPLHAAATFRAPANTSRP